MSAPNPNPDSGPSGPAILIAMVAVVGIGYLLVTKLSAASRLEDCLMSGRTNCAPIDRP